MSVISESSSVDSFLTTYKSVFGSSFQNNFEVSTVPRDSFLVALRNNQLITTVVFTIIAFIVFYGVYCFYSEVYNLPNVVWYGLILYCAFWLGIFLSCIGIFLSFLEMLMTAMDAKNKEGGLYQSFFDRLILRQRKLAFLKLFDVNAFKLGSVSQRQQELKFIKNVEQVENYFLKNNTRGIGSVAGLVKFYEGNLTSKDKKLLGDLVKSALNSATAIIRNDIYDQEKKVGSAFVQKKFA